MTLEDINKWLDNEYGISYTRLEELHDFYFEKYCDLKEQNKKYKEVIDKAKTELEQGITFCQNDSQGLYDKCNIAINRDKRILDILKEVE